MKEKKPFWKRGWVIFLFVLLALIVWGYFSINNFGEASPVPVYTPLAAFEPRHLTRYVMGERSPRLTLHHQDRIQLQLRQHNRCPSVRPCDEQ